MQAHGTNQNTKFLTKKVALKEIAKVEKFLKLGFPGEMQTQGSNQKTAIRMAADELGYGRAKFVSLKSRVGWPTSPNGVYSRLFKLKVNWSLFAPPTSAQEVENDMAREVKRDLFTENRKLRESIVELNKVRSGIMKLVEEPLRPRMEPVSVKSRNGQYTVIVHLSDWHCGEVVNIDEMEGLNSYNLSIFKSRVNKLGAAAKSLLTQYWKGDRPPEKIILIFGGDMITGEIHEELAKTNDALSAPAVRHCAERLAGLVDLFRTLAPVDVYSIPGNHGRLTKKPESKGMAVNSFDTLITHVVEMICQHTKGKPVRFFYPKSGDALFKVYHLTFCAAHGDRIGSKGGQGFIGPIATILRGLAKTRAYYAGQQIMLDYVLVGHFHTTSKLPRGFSNGSLPGPSEYSRDLKADPEPAKQNMIIVHSEKGVIDFQELLCGSTSEGSIYRAG